MRFATRLVAFVLILVAIAPAQFWEKKPWTQWNKREVEQLLENSPWAKTQSQSTVAIKATRPGTLPSEGAAENVPRITYTVQLRSAQIVRQAVVRQAQLKARYDDMNPQQKSAFDAKTQTFLAGPPDPQIAVHVTFDSSVPGHLIDLQNYWARQTAGILQNTVFLSLPGGRKITPVDYTPPRGGGFVLIFERPKDIPPSGELHLEFVGPGSSTLDAQRISIGFNLAKMVVNGNLDF